MKKWNILLLAFAITIAATPALAQGNQTGSSTTASKSKHHIVMEITSGDTLTWKGAMNNIKHLKEKWGQDVLIELVAHGPGIDMLIKAKSTQQAGIAALAAEGVVFSACANSLKARNYTKDDVLGEAGVVPSGVVEVVTRQEDGWTYLKLGF